MQSRHPSSLLALDVGGRRIGVALADLQARIAHPLTTLQRSDNTVHDIQALVDAHAVKAIAIGLPRGLDGQHTAQTVAVEAFWTVLEQALTVPLYWQDEALTSRQAEAELQARNKPYAKEDIDALSATYILEDFIRDHPEIVS